MSELWRGLRLSVRSLRRTPAFSVIAILTLALGIGGTTAMFSIVNGVLLQPLSYRDPGQLVVIRESIKELAHLYPALPANALHLEAWRDRCAAIQGAAIMRGTTLNLTGNGEPLQLTVLSVSPSILQVLGVQPALGRGFLPEEENKGRNRVVVLTDSFWRRIGADPALVGRTLTLDGLPHTVVGVLPASFRFPTAAKWGPLEGLPPGLDLLRPESLNRADISPMAEFNYAAFARLKPGASIHQAVDQINAVQAQIVHDSGEKLTLSALVDPLQEIVVGESRRGLLLLLGAVGAVLLIVCVNLANLMLVRGAGRGREVAIRLAMGADRAGLVRMALRESLLLAIPGGLLGLGLAWGAVRLLVSRSALELPRIDEISVDWRTALFAIAVSLVTAAAFGMLPAWRLGSVDPQESLKAGSHTTTESRASARVRSLLVGTQAALGATLLVFAGLLSTSLLHLLNVDKGFRTERVLASEVVLPTSRYEGQPDRTRFYDKLLAQVHALPGVESAALVSHMPLRGQVWINPLSIEGDTRPMLQRPMANIRFISPGYFQTMRMQLLNGRDFAEADRERKVIILSEAAAKLLWPGLNPLGRTLRFGGPDSPVAEVVGVVKDNRSVELDQGPVLMAYLPHWQQSRTRAVLMIRTAADPLQMAGVIRRAVHEADAEVPVAQLLTMDTVVDQAVARRRFQAALALGFAVFALLLAGLGVYGVVSYWVARRRTELGIRAALGAQRAELFRLVLGRGLAPVCAGLAVGLVIALLGGRIVESLLFEVKATDPWVYGLVAAALGGLCTLACGIPAMRAAGTQAVQVLRDE
ncbi:ABC transporter permease [Paludibaculum fermentans]|uniref:ABC transporter permease n=1 Tax=Paludibaculum fermentans TaxID=1473598 RepID=A0A7S7NP21_PALFE|nr:ABC transporter permease [Paludibaculum fermentans]QOY87109.1 ABC transporter permease [Paludibaculum fermentans]